MSTMPVERFDIVIVGGSSAALGAALGAGRMGARTALIEDTPVLGGMLSNGICNIDSYSLESLSGIFEEFRRRVQSYYRPIMASDPIYGTRIDMPAHIDGRSRAANNPDDGGRWEPHVADRIFKDMAAEIPALHVFYNRYATDVIKVGNRITGVVTGDDAGDRRVFQGQVIIDATHEGDVAAWAGVPYRIGREPRSRLEPHAGEIYFFNGTSEIMEGSSGRQDRAIVSYGLRLTLQRYDHSNDRSHILKTPPPGYEKSKFQHSFFGGKLVMPNGKLEMNINPIGNELQEINWTWPEATREDRQRLYGIYKDNALAFLYYLQHERGMAHLGLPRDEYTDNDNVPYRLFVREARRIVGEATVCESDINPFLRGCGLVPPFCAESIAVGNFPIDSKPVHAKTEFSRPDKGEGDFFLVDASAPFQVPYGAIVPVQVEGLLVPAALSATHVAFSSVRMDPTWMVLGQAAGVAAVLSIRAGCEVRDVPVPQLQRELLRQKCRLVFYWDLPLDHPHFEAVQWLSLRQATAGGPDRLYRPDQPMTRAEMASMLVAALDVWPSVSGLHFTDVPYDHPALRDIETLFDHRALEFFGISPRWPLAGPYDAARDSDFSSSRRCGQFLPGEPVLWGQLVATAKALDGRVAAPEGVDHDKVATRAEACAFLADVISRGSDQQGDTI